MSLRVRTALLATSLVATATAAQAQAQEPNESFREVRVGRAETLATLSYRVYGTHRMWWRIYQWNRDSIPNPNQLKTGQVVRVSADGQILRLAQEWRKANGSPSALIDQWLGTSVVFSSAAAPVKPAVMVADAAIAPQGVEKILQAEAITSKSETKNPEPVESVADVIQPTPLRTPASVRVEAPLAPKPQLADLFGEPIAPRPHKKATPPPSPHLELQPFWGMEMP